MLQMSAIKVRVSLKPLLKCSAVPNDLTMHTVLNVRKHLQLSNPNSNTLYTLITAWLQNHCWLSFISLTPIFSVTVDLISFQQSSHLEPLSPPTKRHSEGFSLAGRWLPGYSAVLSGIPCVCKVFEEVFAILDFITVNGV